MHRDCPPCSFAQARVTPGSCLVFRLWNVGMGVPGWLQPEEERRPGGLGMARRKPGPAFRSREGRCPGPPWPPSFCCQWAPGGAAGVVALLSLAVNTGPSHSLPHLLLSPPEVLFPLLSLQSWFSERGECPPLAAGAAVGWRGPAGSWKGAWGWTSPPLLSGALCEASRVVLGFY